MDLIYATANNEDLGILQSYDLDIDLGTDNTFSLTMDTDIVTLQPGYHVYAENTEYGGIIDSIKIVTKKNQATYTGRTFRGLLSSKIICPEEDEAYYTVSGELNSVISSMIAYCDLDNLFEGLEDSTDFSVSDFFFARYTDLYSGLRAMVNSVGAKLNLAWNKTTGKITLSAVAVEDYSSSHEVDSDKIDFTLSQTKNIPNHVIGLGGGELEERLVIHRYIDADGAISEEQYYTGADEWTIVYDYPNVESIEELITGASEMLMDQYIPAEIQVNVTDIELDIDDYVTARDIATDISVKARVINKIIQVSNGLVRISYKVE